MDQFSEPSDKIGKPLNYDETSLGFGANNAIDLASNALLYDKDRLASIALDNFSIYDKDKDAALSKEELDFAANGMPHFEQQAAAQILSKNFYAATEQAVENLRLENQFLKTGFAKQKMEELFGGDANSKGVTKKDLEALKVMAQFGSLTLVMSGIDEVDHDRIRRVHRYRGEKLDDWR